MKLIVKESTRPEDGAVVWKVFKEGQQEYVVYPRRDIWRVAKKDGFLMYQTESEHATLLQAFASIPGELVFSEEES